MAKYTVTLKKLIDDLNLTEVFLPLPAGEIKITSPEVNRPGLQLAGFFDYFDENRIQIVGLVEYSYLSGQSAENRRASSEKFMSLKPAAVIFTRSIECPQEMMEAAKRHGVPLLVTEQQTSTFMAALIAILSVEMAPRITRHGVLVEVTGEGILLLGDSGVGKSETAIELVKRGHRLIADDAVEIRKVSSRTLVGTSPENIRHFIELRGIGVVNVRRLFGMGSVKLTEKIDMVIEMEPWDSKKVYDRMGVENNTMEILGIKVPCLTIPIKPGRNLAVIIETAAMNNREKKFGYDPARELMERLGMDPSEFDGPSANKTL